MGVFLLPAAGIPPAIHTTGRFVSSRRFHFSHRNPGKSIHIISHRLSTSFGRSCLSSHAEGFSSHRIPTGDACSIVDGLVEKLRSWKYFLPGGNWWLLRGDDDGEEGEGRWSKGVTVVQALKRMWFLVSGGRLVICLAFASLLIASISEVAVPHFLTASIFSAQSGKSLMFYKNTKILISLCLVSGIGSGLRSCFFGIANMILVKRMREMLYSNLLLQEMSLFDEETVGDLTSRLGSDCQQVSRVIGNDLNLIFRNAFQGAGALIFLFIISWPLALSMLLICIALSIVLSIYGRFQKRVAKLTQDITARANEVSQETLSLIRTVRIYGTEKQEFERYLTWLERLWDLSLRQSVGYGFWSLTYNFFYHSTQVVAVLIGGVSILHGHITAEQLTKFILYAEWLIYSAWWIGDNWSSLMQSIGASEKVFQLMDLLPRKQLISGGLQPQKLVGHIEFVNVSFCYPSRLTFPAVEHIRLSVLPNKVLAIVGRSGSGKSTIANLLLRLYEPTNGEILVDGIPLRDLDIKWLRERIGYVGQEPPLFRMDVTSNIRYGCTRETTQKDVEFAAKQAFAHEFILSLPKGYSTLVDGALLSGGQKQRIAIARAILRDPAILILDEATSALDAESEHYVKELLLSERNVASRKRTVMVIAHRLSTVQAADTIVVMDSGRVVEIGNHRELMQKDGDRKSVV